MKYIVLKKACMVKTQPIYARKLSFKGSAIEEIAMLPSGNQATVKVRIDLSFMGYVFPRAPQT